MMPSKEIVKTLKMVRMIKRATSINDVADIVDKLFADAPQNVREAVQKTIEVALTIANRRIDNMDDVRSLVIDIAKSYGVPENQIDDFVDTMLSVASMVADYISSTKSGELE